MKPQPPAQGILLHKDYGDAKYYTVSCECYSTDCAHTVCVEAEDTGVTVTTYTTQKTKWWEFNRFRIIWRLLTKGYVEYEATIIMNEQQALNYANVLTQSVNDVKIFKQQRKSKQNV
jgi:hypothetical protein